MVEKRSKPCETVTRELPVMDGVVIKLKASVYKTDLVFMLITDENGMDVDTVTMSAEQARKLGLNAIACSQEAAPSPK